MLYVDIIAPAYALSTVHLTDTLRSQCLHISNIIGYITLLLVGKAQIE
jgi:hypothetical protein